MVALITTLVLYVTGFVFLYGVIRIAVRHGIQDAERRLVWQRRAERAAVERDRAFVRSHTFLAGRQ